jgi:acetyl esterase/lipase
VRYVRFVFALALFLVSLLAVIPAPNYDTWELSIAVTELGWVVALASLLVLLPGWRRTAWGRVAAALGFAAFMLALSPIIRALPHARSVRADIISEFGPAEPKTLPGAVPRTKSFVLRDLITGVHTDKTRMDSLAFSVTEGRQLYLDLYRPLNSGDALPLVVTIHGGSWRGGNRHELSALNYYLAARGYAVASVDYRLAPQFPHPAASRDVDAAIQFLKAKAATLQIDPTRIALIGRSAGAQLALLEAYTSTDSSIRGVVALYAPSDQNYGYDHPANPRVINSSEVLRNFLAGTPQTKPAEYRAASPVNFVGSSTQPTLLIHGVKDELVSVHQSERLDAKLAEAHRPHLFLRFPWATHGCDYFFSGPCGQISTYAIERFLANVMR